MNAIIYAAGRATRLGPAYQDRTKILLEFGGKSLLQWHVENLMNLGVRRVGIVTGYRAEQVRMVIPALRCRYGADLFEIYNPDFCSGSAVSMLASLPEIERAAGTILLMDGDVLYHQDVLRQLIESKYPTALLLDCNYSKADDDPVLVPIREGRPFEFRKQWEGEADLVGESIGFYKVGAQDIPFLIAEIRKRSRGLARRDSYDEIIRALVRTGRFQFENATGLPWIEIDFPYDVVAAEELVLPRLISENFARETGR
ncbi:MAG: phosphocholine cytidylyltransferase family protein [Verrucomicrobiae bacterium]|nr:phosphocholine cytidylyltransferase family protein [Verrucomicrobiae bacterium]